MKKTILSLIIGSATLGLASCSDDYLNVSPESDLSTSTVFSNMDLLNGAVNGLSQIMSEQYSSSGFGRQGYNGEATITLWYGAYGGGDAQYSNATSYLDVVNRTFHLSASLGATYYPWYYYYMLIANSNAIMANIDGVPGSEQERDFYKAQTLTYRAYAYSQLAQLYCKRWCDSNNGSSRGLPIRLDQSTGDFPCSSLADVYKQVYSDLDEALDLFESSGMKRGSDNWRTDASVAHAVYTRAALAREDWSAAADHAAKARVGYTLMGIDNYGSGFNTCNSEWIWSTYTSSTENLGVYGFFAYIGSNTSSSKGYKYIGTISKDLYEQIPLDDSRRWIFMAPKDGESGWSLKDSGKATSGDFYDRVKVEYADYIDSKSTVIYPYMSVKFRTITDRSIGCVPIMRAAEMYYSEAEALWHLGGQETRIRSLLEEVVKPYQPNYTCNLSGQALLDEVKLYRRFDLWGEGRSWFDMKRWKESLVRKTWAEGGNWHPQFTGSGSTGGCYGPEDRNGWTICIPERETNYNRLITNNVEPDNWTAGTTE